jgi:hypothetical protein
MVMTPRSIERFVCFDMSRWIHDLGMAIVLLSMHMMVRIAMALARMIVICGMVSCCRGAYISGGSVIRGGMNVWWRVPPGACVCSQTG